MSRESHVPSYRKHKQSGQAIVTLPDGTGGRRDVLLGKFGTKKSRVEYARIIGEWEAGGRSPGASLAKPKDLTINELAFHFMRHAAQHYRRPDGTRTNEFNDYKLTLRPLTRVYGDTFACNFGPLALKAVQRSFADGNWMTDKERARWSKKGWPIGCCRGVVNQRVGRIRNIFRWGVENELVPATVLFALKAVRGLQLGRTDARETEPIRPVPVDQVYKILPFLRPQVAAMVQLQLLTGMRPGELVVMRAIDIDTTGKVWLYRPGSDQGAHGAHKTAHHGFSRVIPIGPRGQEIVKRFLKPDLYAYLFCAWEAVVSLRAEQRARRKTKVQPSQQNRKKRRPKWKHYRVGSYGLAIARACEKAGVPHWHPHQLRHTKATEIRREAGLDAARAVLGHRSPRITEVYAELDAGKAAEIMERLG
jgi:integrase